MSATVIPFDRWLEGWIISWPGTWHIPRPEAVLTKFGTTTSLCGRYGYVYTDERGVVPEPVRIKARQTKRKRCAHCVKMAAR